MDMIPDKAWAVVAAIVSALGGYVVYDHKRVDSRLSKVERGLAHHNTELAVIREGLLNLKEDTQEIKDLLVRRRK